MLMTVREFTERAMTAMPELVRELQRVTGRVGDEEERAWKASLLKLAYVLDDAELEPFHIHMGPTSGGMSLEYRLPASSSWCDAVLLGEGESAPAAVMIELKHWDLVGDRPGPRPGLITHRGEHLLHPSEQVRGYVEYCERFHSAVQEQKAALAGCALLTKPGDVTPYRSGVHKDLTETFPVFGATPDDCEVAFPQFVRQRLKRPNAAFAQAFENGYYAQDRSFVRGIARTIEDEAHSAFVLLDAQRKGFELCLKAVDELLARGADQKAVLIIKGPPGSGKSILAAKLWAALAKDDRLEGNKVMVTTSGSQKTNVSDIFASAANNAAGAGVVVPANQFNPGLSSKWQSDMTKLGRSVTVESWRENLKLFALGGGVAKIADNHMAVSVVDEAHALIDPSLTENRGIAPSGWSIHAGPQAYHVMRASRLSVFLLDPDQSYRDNETTTIDVIRALAAELGAEVLEDVSLEGAQFRCAGSAEFVAQLDRVLGLAATTGSPLGESHFPIEMTDSPAQLESRLRAHSADGHTVRLLASYAREWKTKGVKAPHGLVAEAKDFCIPIVHEGAPTYWAKVWNYAPDQDYTLFVQAPQHSAMHADPLCEVGCPYVVRGFDWDYVGVLWLNDLVWRTNRWVANMAHVKETAWNKTMAAAKKEHKKAEYGDAMHRLQDRIARGYRILLTRGVRGAYVWCEDDETREYLRGEFARWRAGDGA